MKIAVLGADLTLGRLIVEAAEADGIKVTSIVSSPLNLPGNGPVIIKTLSELQPRDLQGFHVLIDAYSFAPVHAHGSCAWPRVRHLAAAGEPALMTIGLSAFLYTDKSQKQLIGSSALEMPDLDAGEWQELNAMIMPLRRKRGRWLMLCPPLAIDHAVKGRHFEFCDEVLPLGLDGASAISPQGLAQAAVELLKLGIEPHFNHCVGVRQY